MSTFPSFLSCNQSTMPSTFTPCQLPPPTLLLTSSIPTLSTLNKLELTKWKLMKWEQLHVPLYVLLCDEPSLTVQLSYQSTSQHLPTGRFYQREQALINLVAVQLDPRWITAIEKTSSSRPALETSQRSIHW